MTALPAPTALLPRARRASRGLVLGAVLSAPLLRRVAGGGAAQQALVLGALALGMPHGAADTELLKAAARGDRRRHAGLVAGYAAAAAVATGVVRRGGPLVERAVLLGSAAHFAEGELACWEAGPSGRTARVLRLLAAATATLALPAAVGRGARRTTSTVGVTGAVDRLAPHPGGAPASPGTAGDRSGWQLVRSGDRPVAALAALGLGTAALLGARGDRPAAGDTALLTALALVAPPSTAFSAYFGGWHALRHTARVVDALTARGALPAQASLPRAVGTLGRRSAWAAAVGLGAAGVLAVRDPEHASDNAFAAVLGLTVPHMTTVALELAVRQGR